MIPKVIHYCWFGDGEISDIDKRCIESWNKYCPGYEIKQWNESNYDIRKNRYMFNAYQEKKWAFMSDYARFDIIYQHGGFYLDTDVELVKTLDELSENQAYMGFESGNWINSGIGFGAESNNTLIMELRDMYDGLSFYNENHSLNLEPTTHYITELLEKKGLVRNNQAQIIEGLRIYPIEYFAAKDYYTGKVSRTLNTVSIHQYNASWQTPHRRRMMKVKRVIGERNYNLLLNIKNGIMGKKFV